MEDRKTILTPDGAAPPFGAYAHGVVAHGPGRLLLTSGQLGLPKDGACPADVASQAEICFATIDAILTQAGGTRADVLRLNAFVTARDDFPAYMAVRDQWLTEVTNKPASTLVIVTGFTRPEFLVEIEATAWLPVD
ncbi:MAG: RidA family protein [Pseudomonadota bacterium]